LIPGKVPDVLTQEAFVKKISDAVEEAREGENVVLFSDPVHQIHNNENDYAWQFKGKEGTKNVLANAGRRRLNIIGALNPLLLKTTTLLMEGSCDREVIKVFLRQIRQDYPNAPKITVFLDNAGYNRAYDVQELAQELNITLSYLPPYAPNLNLIERLWKFFKKKVMKNTYYPSFQSFYQAIDNFFKNFSDYEKELTSLLTLKFQIIKAS
jgi:transposase